MNHSGIDAALITIGAIEIWIAAIASYYQVDQPTVIAFALFGLATALLGLA